MNGFGIRNLGFISNLMGKMAEKNGSTILIVKPGITSNPVVT
ncbi:hypothetical protein AMCSP02_000953 [Streptococcus pneumoniae 2061617]|nr:hypothetical protein AMCSP02_000953 [Streptococcus pneumoniae 2061617]